jgi:hypothetical protein
MNMEKLLADLVIEVANDQAAIDAQCEDTRRRIIRMGKRLSQLQKEQKKEQKEQAALGQPVTTWKEWVEKQKDSLGSFPASVSVIRYMLIARYPAAYRAGMSIKEAYKEAGKWKKNGGNPPLVEKVTILARPLVTIGATAGKLNGKIEKLLDEDMAILSKKQKWTEDEVLGATDEIALLRQACNHLLKELKSIHASM